MLAIYRLKGAKPTIAMILAYRRPYAAFAVKSSAFQKIGPLCFAVLYAGGNTQKRIPLAGSSLVTLAERYFQRYTPARCIAAKIAKAWAMSEWGRQAGRGDNLKVLMGRNLS